MIIMLQVMMDVVVLACLKTDGRVFQMLIDGLNVQLLRIKIRLMNLIFVM